MITNLTSEGLDLANLIAQSTIELLGMLDFALPLSQLPVL
jgi:hypothetical protein